MRTTRLRLAAIAFITSFLTVQIFVLALPNTPQELPDFTILKLPPGDYGSLNFGLPTMLILRSGEYHFAKLTFENQSLYRMPSVWAPRGTSNTIVNVGWYSAVDHYVRE